MIIITTIPWIYILVLVLAAGGITLGILQSITKIIFTILTIISVIAGLAIIIKGISSAREGKGLIHLIAETLRGIFVVIALPLVRWWLDTGRGKRAFNDATFVLLGTFRKIDDYTASILIVSVLLLILFSLMFIGLSKKHKSKIALPIISIFVIFTIFFGGFRISFDSEMNNSCHAFNWEYPEYEVIKDTAIFHDEIKTGVFRKETQLFTVNSNIHFNSKDKVEVSDGKRVGIVSVKDLKPLVTYYHTVNTDANLYSLDSEIHYNGSKFYFANEDIIMVIKKGTKISKFEGSKNGYTKVEFQDGTKGYIKLDQIASVKE